MNSSFMTLVGFEFKKIFKRKGTYFALAMAVIVVLIATVTTALGVVHYLDGTKESRYSMIKAGQKIQRDLAGDIDEKLVREAITQSQIAWSDPANLSESPDKVYEESIEDSHVASYYVQTLTPEAHNKYVRPYEPILNMIRQVYSPPGASYSHEIEKTLNPDEAKDFYTKWQAKIDEKHVVQELSEAEIAKHNKMKAQVSLPLKYDEAHTLTMFSQMIAVVAIFAALAISICVAPIFAGEYSTRTDQLILTSKYGKNRVILAKIVAGLAFSVLITLALIVLTLIILIALYGLNGAGAGIQVIESLSDYPLTVLQAAFIVGLLNILAVTLVCGITMLLSAIFKSSFPVIIIINLLIFVPLIVPQDIPISLLRTIIKLMPSNMVMFYNIFNPKFFNVFGLAVTPPVFQSILCIAIIAITLPLSYRAFKNHQIG